MRDAEDERLAIAELDQPRCFGEIRVIATRDNLFIQAYKYIF